MPRALIIGHHGQDGRILWGQLANLGHSLVGIARDCVQVHGLEWDDPCNIDDADQVRRLIEGVMPTEVYFLAAHHHSSQDRVAADAALWNRSWATHVLAFTNVLAAVAESSPKAKVFYASSSRIFGPATSGCVNESSPRNPEDCYGVTKAAGMNLADYYRRVHGVAVSCGILFNHESALRQPQFITQRVVRGLVAIQRGEIDHLELGSLGASVDWGYAPDYTRAMQMILATETPGDFVVATGVLHSVRDLVEAAAEHIGLDWRSVVVEAGGILNRRAQGLCGDSSRLREMTGWAPTVSFDEMIGCLIDAELARVG